MESTPRPVLPGDGGPPRPGQPDVRRSGRRRRPTGQPPPLPRSIQPTGVWWAAAAVVLAATLSAGSVFLATAGDRRLAASYQAVLSQGQGSFFAAAPLQGARAMVTLQPSIHGEGRFQPP